MPLASHLASKLIDTQPISRNGCRQNPPRVVQNGPSSGTRQTRQMPSASLILLAKARRWFSDAALAGAGRPRSGALVASAAQRRCWLVGPAPVGAGEASARSPTAVRSPLRSAPLHSWPSAPGINRRPLPNRSACRVPPTPGQGLYVATPRRPPLSALYPAGRPRAPVPQPGRLALGPQNATRDRYPLGIELAAGPGLPAPLHRVAVVVPFPPGSGHLLPWRTARKSPIRLATPPMPLGCARAPIPRHPDRGFAAPDAASSAATLHTGQPPISQRPPWHLPSALPLRPADTP